MSLVHTQTETVYMERPVASKYERVHFVAHCRFGFVDEKALEEEFKAKIPEMEAEIGYRVFYRGMKVKGLEPIWLDIDFILDLPAGSPVAPVIIAAVIIILGTLGILIIIFLWWTIWHEESEIFYCDQCPVDGDYEGFKAERIMTLTYNLSIQKNGSI